MQKSEDIVGIDRDQWVQWLVSQSMNSGMRIWANIDDDGDLSSYIVAYDCVDMPVSDHVYILYFWADRDREVNEALLGKVKDWAKSIGAKTLQASTVEPEDFQNYGFAVSLERIVEAVV
jgi:hypothetical protein